MQDVHTSPHDPDSTVPYVNGNSEAPTNDVESLGAPVDAQAVNGTPKTPAVEDTALVGGRGKKRKFEDMTPSKSNKKPSPPWKSFSAEGVTTFTEDGRRKSSRTNAVPLDLQPQKGKRQTRGEYSRYQEERGLRSDTARQRRGSAKAAASPAAATERKYHAKSSSITSATQITKRSQAHHHHKRSRSDAHSRHANSQSSPTQDAAITMSQPSPSRSGRQRRPSQRFSESETSPRVKRKYTRRQPAAVPTADAPTGPRIRLRLGPRTLPTLCLYNIPKPKKYESLRDYLNSEDIFEGDEDHRLTEAEALHDAQIIQRARDVLQSGEMFNDLESSEFGSAAIDRDLERPSHTDYLAKHAIDLQHRIFREAREHRSLAKKTAMLAAAKAQNMVPKSAEESARELEKAYRKRMLELYKILFKSLRFGFDKAAEEVLKQKRAEYQAREIAAGREQMNKWADRSGQLLAARSGHRNSLDSPGDLASGEDSMLSNSEDYESDGDDESDESDEDSDSESSSSEEDATGENPDENLTAEELHEKYSKILDVPLEEAEPSDASEASDADQDQTHGLERGIDPANVQLDDVDDALMDDEDDESSEDDDDSDDSDESRSDESLEASDEESDASSEDLGLFGFLSNDLRRKVTQAPPEELVEKTDHEADKTDIADGAVLEEVPTSDEVPLKIEERPSVTPEAEAAQPTPGLNSTSDEPSRHTSPDTSTTSHVEQPESMSSMDTLQNPGISALIDRASEHNETAKIPIPSLLRGQLRPYQHAGLEWLALMYESDTNGILADEMGLGKTFQTIALIAYLATHHHVWGPHLVVVPTSVMLNWEMEFKKFCPGLKILTYYGTQEERKAKRRGWMDNDKWHVCITSYQLALQDASALKRRDWHYLILDEAHNIKNFRSQRWQTLLSFKSRARLLLTGTPLQNNLSELWSLLFFLAPETDEEGNTSFGDLREFSRNFHHPVDLILEQGRQALDEEGMGIVTKLHGILRPHLLRRLKADVEKQMPKKYEHVTICRLSKRQRQLYDSYMGLAGTRDSFASGNYMSIINCLMQLRKVCNHPDLFETRQIVTSFAMPKPAVLDYEIKELLVRRRLLQTVNEDERLDALDLWRPNRSKLATLRIKQLDATAKLRSMVQGITDSSDDPSEDWQSVTSSLTSLNFSRRSSRLDQIQRDIASILEHNQTQPAYDEGLLKLLSIPSKTHKNLVGFDGTSEINMNTSSTLDNMVLSLTQRSEKLQPYVQRFGCITPAVTASPQEMSRLALTERGTKIIRQSHDQRRIDPFHEARVRLSIAFPDKSLIQYDCGKLQQLAKLLRRLQSEGHRALIFTQMTKVLDILEQFMNLHGHRYLRLDGATKIEQRQVLTDRFNNDPRILAFILSSRSGGLGINLTGADTVIFYDLDWNPAMDKQCQDRCHRIGQTRDVHIYRFVSEGTIEANILRKSNQKRMLDDVVIQEGDFTTEYFNKMDFGNEGDAEADAALDKVLGGGKAGGTGAGNQVGRVLEHVEDKEDQEAAKVAQKEDTTMDDADFDDKTAAAPPSAVPIPTADPLPSTETKPPIAATVSDIAQPPDTTPAPSQKDTAMLDDEAREQLMDAFASKPLPQDKHGLAQVDDEENAVYGAEHYMVRFKQWEMRDVVWTPPRTAKDRKKKAKKGADYGRIRR